MPNLKTTFAVVSLAFLLIRPGVVHGEMFDGIGHANISGIAGKQSAALVAAKHAHGKTERASGKRKNVQKKAKKCALKGKKKLSKAKKKAGKQTKKKVAKSKKYSLKRSKKKTKKSTKPVKRNKATDQDKKKRSPQAALAPGKSLAGKEVSSGNTALVSRKCVYGKEVFSEVLFEQLTRQEPGALGMAIYEEISNWVVNLPGDAPKISLDLDTLQECIQFISKERNAAQSLIPADLMACLDLLNPLLTVQRNLFSVINPASLGASALNKAFTEVGDSTLAMLVLWFETFPGGPVKVDADLSRLMTLADWSIKYIESLEHITNIYKLGDSVRLKYCVGLLKRFLGCVKKLAEEEQNLRLQKASVPAIAAA